MKIIPMLPEAAYRGALSQASESYNFNEYPEEIQKLLKKVFRAGWVASKENTLEILETITCEANDDGTNKQ